MFLFTIPSDRFGNNLQWTSDNQVFHPNQNQRNEPIKEFPLNCNVSQANVEHTLILRGGGGGGVNQYKDIFFLTFINHNEAIP
jgi:hypothetical protein